MAITVTTNSPDLTAAINRLITAIDANTAAMKAQSQALNSLTSVEQEIEEELKPTAQSATLQVWHMVDSKGVAMPLTLQVNGPGGSIAPPPAGSPAGVGFEEWDGANGTGNQVAPIGPTLVRKRQPRHRNRGCQRQSGRSRARAVGSDRDRYRQQSRRERSDHRSRCGAVGHVERGGERFQQTDRQSEEITA